MLVCGSCGQENPAGSRFCNACGAPFEAPAPSQEERKVVTVVFADLVGSTARAERLDPEDVRAILAPYHGRLREELERFGGTVEKFIGDAVVAVFGAPAAHEDDPERAVRAALEIQDAIAELNELDSTLELEVRIGVNTGEALVSLGARPEAGEGMVSGDVMNTAARLQSAAPPGGVLVGELTHRATERAIDYVEQPPVEAKGKAEPVAAWRALTPRVRFGSDLAVAGRARLVGRDREMHLLRDALERTRADGRPQLVTLVGVPGIGKSRLVHELSTVADADPDLIFWRQGRSLPYGEGVTFWALGEIVKAQAGILESDGGAEAGAKLGSTVRELIGETGEAAWVERQLRPLIGLEDTAHTATDRGEAFAARRRFLEGIAEAGPAVVVFEDLHWADDDLLDFVDELTDQLDAVPLLLVCTARPELLDRRPGWGGGKPNALTLSLAPLSDDETAQLLAMLLERSVLPAEEHRILLERAGGVPLFAEEYARAVDSERGGGVPETLQGLVAARVDGLPSREKSLLQDAAVLGKVFWTDALAELTDARQSEVDELLRALERKEFVRRERRSAVADARQYAFLHALVRDAAYRALPRVERARRHRRTADWIDTLPEDRADDRAETLAHHLEQAIAYGEAVGEDATELRPRATAALREAGERAWSLGLAPRAADFYRRAIDVGVGDDVGPDLLYRLGRALHRAGGEGERELRMAADAYLDAGDRLRGALALTALGNLLRDKGQPDVGVWDRAGGLVEHGEPSAVRSEVLREIGFNLGQLGRADEGLPLIDESLAIAEQLRDRALYAYALDHRGGTRLQVGDVAGGVDDLRQALELTREIGPADEMRSHNNLAACLFTAGAPVAEWEAHHRAGLELAQRLGLAGWQRWLQAELTVDAYFAGRWDEASALADDVIAQREQGHSSLMHSFVFAVRASIATDRNGAPSEADVTMALDLARETAEPGVILGVTAIIGRTRAQSGHTDSSASFDRMLAIAGDVAAQTDASHWLVDGARAAVFAGREADLLEVLPEVRTPWRKAAFELLNGDAVAAADTLAEIGCPGYEAEARALAARALAAAGDTASAAEQGELARALYAGLGASAAMARLDAALGHTAAAS